MSVTFSDILYSAWWLLLPSLLKLLLKSSWCIFSISFVACTPFHSNSFTSTARNVGKVPPPLVLINGNKAYSISLDRETMMWEGGRVLADSAKWHRDLLGLAVQVSVRHLPCCPPAPVPGPEKQTCHYEEIGHTVCLCVRMLKQANLPNLLLFFHKPLWDSDGIFSAELCLQMQLERKYVFLQNLQSLGFTARRAFFFY